MTSHTLPKEQYQCKAIIAAHLEEKIYLLTQSHSRDLIHERGKQHEDVDKKENRMSTTIQVLFEAEYTALFTNALRKKCHIQALTKKAHFLFT